MAKPKYLCPRCNYTTCHKPAMRTHFYNLKKPCPAASIAQNKPLTEEDKVYVLNNRVLTETSIIPIVQCVNHNVTQSVNHNVTTNHQNVNHNHVTQNIQNIILNMDDIDKIKLLLQYQNKTLIGYGDQIEQENSKTITKLKENSFTIPFRIEPEGFLEIIDQSSGCRNPEHNNILFHRSLNKILMYQDDEWESFLTEPGIKKVITRNRDYYLESYEYFLLQNYFDMKVNAQLRNDYRNQLAEYYRFLAHFDVNPSSYVDFSDNRKINSDILPTFRHDNEYYLSEFCMDLYKKEKDQLKKLDISKMKTQVFDIIKNNSQYNIKNINKNIISLVHMDPNFKTRLIHQIDLDNNLLLPDVNLNQDTTGILPDVTNQLQLESSPA